MWFSNDGIPSLVVEDDATYTLTSVDSELSRVALRPMSTAALLVACGIISDAPVRLSDRTAFEEVAETDDLVEIGTSGKDGRIGGFTAPFLRRILTSLDPEAPVPEAVRLKTPARLSRDCNCRSTERAPAGEETFPRVLTRRAVAHDVAIRADVQTPVPAFMRRLAMFVWAPLLQDIIVGFNSTLVIHESIHHLLARNIWCYRGSAIRQQGGYLAVDADLIRGGIPRIFHTIDRDLLKVDEQLLADMPAVMN